MDETLAAVSGLGRGRATVWGPAGGQVERHAQPVVRHAAAGADLLCDALQEIQVPLVCNVPGSAAGVSELLLAGEWQISLGLVNAEYGRGHAGQHSLVRGAVRLRSLSVQETGGADGGAQQVHGNQDG